MLCAIVHLRSFVSVGGFKLKPLVPGVCVSLFIVFSIMFDQLELFQMGCALTSELITLSAEGIQVKMDDL